MPVSIIPLLPINIKSSWIERHVYPVGKVADSFPLLQAKSSNDRSLLTDSTQLLLDPLTWQQRPFGSVNALGDTILLKCERRKSRFPMTEDMLLRLTSKPSSVCAASCFLWIRRVISSFFFSPRGVCWRISMSKGKSFKPHQRPCPPVASAPKSNALGSIKWGRNWDNLGDLRALGTHQDKLVEFECLIILSVERGTRTGATILL